MLYLRTSLILGSWDTGILGLTRTLKYKCGRNVPPSGSIPFSQFDVFIILMSCRTLYICIYGFIIYEIREGGLPLASLRSAKERISYFSSKDSFFLACLKNTNFCIQFVTEGSLLFKYRKQINVTSYCKRPEE